MLKLMSREFFPTGAGRLHLEGKLHFLPGCAGRCGHSVLPPPAPPLTCPGGREMNGEHFPHASLPHTEGGPPLPTRAGHLAEDLVMGPMGREQPRICPRDMEVTGGRTPGATVPLSCQTPLAECTFLDGVVRTVNVEPQSTRPMCGPSECQACVMSPTTCPQVRVRPALLGLGSVCWARRACVQYKPPAGLSRLPS